MTGCDWDVAIRSEYQGRLKLITDMPISKSPSWTPSVPKRDDRSLAHTEVVLRSETTSEKKFRRCQQIPRRFVDFRYSPMFLWGSSLSSSALTHPGVMTATQSHTAAHMTPIWRLTSPSSLRSAVMWGNRSVGSQPAVKPSVTGHVNPACKSKP